MASKFGFNGNAMATVTDFSTAREIHAREAGEEAVDRIVNAFEAYGSRVGPGPKRDSDARPVRADPAADVIAEFVEASVKRARKQSREVDRTVSAYRSNKRPVDAISPDVPWPHIPERIAFCASRGRRGERAIGGGGAEVSDDAIVLFARMLRSWGVAV